MSSLCRIESFTQGKYSYSYNISGLPRGTVKMLGYLYQIYAYINYTVSSKNIVEIYM